MGECGLRSLWEAREEMGLTDHVLVGPCCTPCAALPHRGTGRRLGAGDLRADGQFLGPGWWYGNFQKRRPAL